MTPTIIKFDKVSKVFPGGTRAVDDLSFEIYEGECVVFLGPSGCGKTTTIKLLNRLEQPTHGKIYLNGQDTSTIDVIALRRSIGYVIQDVGLFPHMTVAQNIALVPRLIGWSMTAQEARVDELLRLVDLEPSAFRDRYPHQLSGGQRQRVGVARGLAADPPVILMDEPFGALDPITRAQLQDEFLRLRSKIKKTILFVTHDIDEAIKLGDRIAVMRTGRIVQFDTPKKIIGEPVDEFVRDFVGKESGLKLMKLFKISDIMVSAPNFITEKTGMTEAKRQMEERRSDVLLVVDEEGVFQGVLRFELLTERNTGTVKEWMERDIPTVKREDEIRPTLERMLKRGVLWLPVVDEAGRLKGIVTMTQFAAFFSSEGWTQEGAS